MANYLPNTPHSFGPPPVLAPAVYSRTHIMSTASSSAVATKKPTGPAAKPPMKKLRPARKQVRPDEIDKTDTVQTGKEYSA